MTSIIHVDIYEFNQPSKNDKNDHIWENGELVFQLETIIPLQGQTKKGADLYINSPIVAPPGFEPGS